MLDRAEVTAADSSKGCALPICQTTCSSQHRGSKGAMTNSSRKSALYAAFIVSNKRMETFKLFLKTALFY